MPVRVQSLRSSVKNQRPAPGSREPGEIFSNFADKQLGVIDASKNPVDLLPIRFFSIATDYAGGDFVINAGVGYKAKGPITAGAFNPAQWDTLATAPALALKEDAIAAGTTAQYWRGDKSWQTLDKNAVGLGQVDNTSDANKPVSTAQAAADQARVLKAGDTMSGHLTLPTGPAAANAVRKDYVDAADAAITSGLSIYAPIASPVFSGDPKAPTQPPGDNDTSIATTAFVTAAVIAGNSGQISDAPSDSQSYGRKNAAWVDVTEEAPSDSLTYGRKNGAWATVVGGAHTDDNPPPGPLVDGQLWWKSSTGDMFVYYVDANSSQWVQINAPSAGVVATAEARNRLVNGAMQISQENVNVAGTVADYYGADQWYTTRSGVVGTFTTQRVQVSTPNGSVNRYRMTVTAADTSITASEFLAIRSSVEGIRVADFRWGFSDARQAILRFGFKAPAGTYSVALRNANGTRAYIATFTIAAGQANTDTTQTFIVPGDTVGPQWNDTSIGVDIWIALACGSSFQTSTGWQGGNYLGTSANTNGLATAGNVFELFDVGLYLDPNNTGIAPPWTMPDEAEELRACMRYWQQIYHAFVSGGVTTGIAYHVYSQLPVRARPGAALSGTDASAANGFASTAGSIGLLSTGSVTEQRGATSTTTNYGRYFTLITANGRI